MASTLGLPPMSINLSPWHLGLTQSGPTTLANDVRQLECFFTVHGDDETGCTCLISTLSRAAWRCFAVLLNVFA